MISVRLRFFDKETGFISEDALCNLSESVVFSATKSEDIEEINAFTFDISDKMKEHVIKLYPHLSEKFEKYDSDFIGRHGLLEGY